MQQNSCRNVNREKIQGQACAAIGAKRIIQERDGKLKNLLKKAYLRHWVGNIDSDTNSADARLNYEGNFNQRKSNYNVDIARFMKLLVCISQCILVAEGSHMTLNENLLTLFRPFFSRLFLLFRMKIENAAFQESLESMEHLTSSVRKLRLALFKVIVVAIVHIKFRGAIIHQLNPFKFVIVIK